MSKRSCSFTVPEGTRLEVFVISLGVDLKASSKGNLRTLIENKFPCSLGPGTYRGRVAPLREKDQVRYHEWFLLDNGVGLPLSTVRYWIKIGQLMQR